MKEQFKEFEMPFNAKDSELCGFTCTIPEGMEATIEGNTVIIKKKESKDERIRKELISFFKDRKSRLDRLEDILDPSNFPCDDYSLCEKAISWLEK